MTYLLLIALPIALAAACFLLRQRSRLVLAVAAISAMAQIGLSHAIADGTPSRLIGLTMSLDPLGRLVLDAILIAGVVVFLAAIWLPHGEQLAPIGTLMLSLAAATVLLIQQPYLATLLLVITALLAVLAIVDLPAESSALVSPRLIATALKFLVLMLLAGVFVTISLVLVGLYRPGADPATSPARFILALLVIGFGLRLALAPLHVWLPDLLDDAAPLVAAFAIALNSALGLLLLVSALQFFPTLVFENERGLGALSALGMGSAVLSAALAVGQERMRRAFGYLCVANAGLIVFGTATISVTGISGGLLLALHQILALTAICIALALIDTADLRGAALNALARRSPVAAIGLLAGVAALIGLPPFGGFAAWLLLLSAAAARGPAFVVGLILTALLGIVAVGRIGYQRLLGPDEDAPPPPPELRIGDLPEFAQRPPATWREPLLPALLVVLLLGVSLASGIYPQPVLDIIARAIRSLTFVRVL